jgi:AcrR family transcriptional regulator
MTTPTVRPRTARAAAAILDAAAAVAQERGYGGAAIEEIAARAGVAKQTVYRWWPTKTALFVDVYERLVPRDAVGRNTGSLRGDLAALLARLSERYTHTPAGAILAGLVAEAQADPAIADRLREVYVAPRRGIVGTVLERAVVRGEIPPVADPGFVSDLFSGAVWFRLLLGERRLDEAFARGLVDAVARSVGA